MAQLQVTRSYPNEGKQCFEAARAGFPKAGFEIWKVRELAYLVIANRQVDGHTVTANIIVFGSEPADVTLSLSSDHHTEAQLQELVEPIFTAFAAALPPHK
jgi:hypothetical protein